MPRQDARSDWPFGRFCPDGADSGRVGRGLASVVCERMLSADVAERGGCMGSEVARDVCGGSSGSRVGAQVVLGGLAVLDGPRASDVEADGCRCRGTAFVDGFATRRRMASAQ